MNKTTISVHASRLLAALVILLGLSRSTVETSAAFVSVGGLAQDFSLKNRKTGQLTNLSDFAGNIIFLDLFAYW